MFKQTLELDRKVFRKHKRIRAKRSSEYWLVFLKKFVLKKHREGFSWTMLAFLIPFVVAGLGALIVIKIAPDFPAIFLVPFFLMIISFIFLAARIRHIQKRDFVDPNVFDHLAKFIIQIKGDTLKNRIGLRLNIAGIEDDDHAMDLKLLGLKEKRGLRYAAYQMERYQANILFKDNSFCTASLYQMVLKTTTTKRRSSGKTKTKSKRKHKFYYILSLKLNADDYQIISPAEILAYKDPYQLTSRTENGYHIVKVKLKEKMLSVSNKITVKQQNETSIFSDMLAFIFSKRIVTTKPEQIT